MTPMEKENHRFDTLTPRQLRSRLNKITTEPKLINFARVATQRGLSDLAMAAESKLHDLFGHTLNSREVSDGFQPPRSPTVVEGSPHQFLHATTATVDFDGTQYQFRSYDHTDSKDEEISELKKRIAELEGRNATNTKSRRERPKRLIDV